MDTTDALDNSLEQSGDQVLDFVHLTNLKDFLELSQKESLFDSIGKWPKSKKTFQKRDSQGAVLGQEEHRATK